MHAYRDQYAQIFNGGRGVVLIAISADSQDDLVSWARDDEFPFLMASDPQLEVAHAYGAVHSTGTVANRSLFVIDGDGTIAFRAIPFREVDPTAYEELEGWIDQITPPPDAEGGEGG